MNVMRFIAGIVIAVLCAAPETFAQQNCWAHWQATGAPYADLDRSLQLADSATLQPVGVTRIGRDMVERCVLTDTLSSFRAFQFGVLPAAAVLQQNSDYARSQQDGLRWAGRGWSSTLQLGAAGRWGPITAAIAPVFSWQENKGFEYLRVGAARLSDFGSYHHPGVIDWPQRFGDESFSWIHPGQSFIRADAYGAAIGVSTENMRWGPARRNPILMSTAGSGFPHVFVGTSKPVNLRIVDVGIEAIWGHLQESEYFDTLSFNDDRLFAGLVATISPRNSGLTIGLARSYLRIIPPGGLSLSDQIIGPYTGIRDNPRGELNGDNQLLSIFLSWTLPAVGFEAYGEYAREDHWEDANDLLMQLDHSRGYTVGFEKMFTRANQHMVRVQGEATNLGISPTFQSRTTGATFYTHSQVRQGYTHDGQLLGAPIGPGSDAQYVAVDYLTPRIFGGLYYERVRYDNDAYYRYFGDLRGPRGHDVEWTIGLRGALQLPVVQFVAGAAYSTRHNRDFVQLVNTGQITKGNNFSINLGVAWTPHLQRTLQP